MFYGIGCWVVLDTNDNMLIDIENKEKWKFCESRQCYYCGEILEERCKEEWLVTCCPFCHRSFVE
jgi:hypothetical protein